MFLKIRLPHDDKFARAEKILRLIKNAGLWSQPKDWTIQDNNGQAIGILRNGNLIKESGYTGLS